MPPARPSPPTSLHTMPQHLHERTRSSPALDDASARRAHMRAIAAGLVDRPRLGRRFHVPEGVPLVGSERRRSHSRRRPPREETRRRPAVRRLVAGAFLLAQVGVLVTLLTAPAFKVHTVVVTGDQLLGRDAVIAAARVPQGSLFTVDGDAIRSRVAGLPWVRSAVVTTQLPSTVRIAVTEWQPELLVHRGTHSDFVAANGATLPFTTATAPARKGVALLLDDRTGPVQPLMAGLTDLLASATARWRTTYGCSVDAFVISPSNQLSAWCSTGWQAVFGALDSSDALAAVPKQLEVLAALKVKLDYTKPTFGYVRLDSPSEPAIGGAPGEPTAVSAEVTASATPPPPPTPAATPAPVASASPTPRPSPTPLVFTLAPPSPTPQH